MPALIIILSIAAVLAVVVWAIEFRTSPEHKRLQKLAEEIRTSGIRVDAVVKRLDDMTTGTSGRLVSLYVEWILEVTLPDGTKVEVSEDIFASDKHRFALNLAVQSYATRVGARIPVIVHPTEHQAIRIDSEQLMKLAIRSGQ